MEEINYSLLLSKLDKQIKTLESNLKTTPKDKQNRNNKDYCINEILLIHYKEFYGLINTMDKSPISMVNKKIYQFGWC